MIMTQYEIAKEREKIYQYELNSLKNSLGDFRLFFQEASHCNDTLLKALHSAYLNAYETGAAVDYAELGKVFAGLITNELVDAAEELTSDRMVKEYV